MNGIKMIRTIEYLRIIWIATGFWLAYANPLIASYYLLVGMVLPMTGLTAIQGLFFSQASEDYMQRPTNHYSHLQSSMIFLGLCITAIGALIIHASTLVQYVLVLQTLLCFLLSGLVHLYQFIKEDKAQRVHLWRFVWVIMLCIVSLIALCLQFRLLNITSLT